MDTVIPIIYREGIKNYVRTKKDSRKRTECSILVASLNVWTKGKVV